MAVGLAVLSAVLMLGIAVAMIVVTRQATLAKRLSEAHDWAARGEPCREVTPAAFAAQPFRIQRTMTYDAMTIGRASGNAECADIRDKEGRGWTSHAACRLTGPAGLSVRYAGRDHLYVTGVGTDVTLSIEGGKLACATGFNDAFGTTSGKYD